MGQPSAFGAALANGGPESPELFVPRSDALLVSDPLAPQVFSDPLSPVPDLLFLDRFGEVRLYRAGSDLFTAPATGWRTIAPVEEIIFGRRSLPFPEQDYQAPYEYGRHIDGGVDVTFDGVPEILVSAPGRPGESPPLGRGYLFPRP